MNEALDIERRIVVFMRWRNRPMILTSQIAKTSD